MRKSCDPDPLLIRAEEMATNALHRHWNRSKLFPEYVATFHAMLVNNAALTSCK